MISPVYSAFTVYPQCHHRLPGLPRRTPPGQPSHFGGRECHLWGHIQPRGTAPCHLHPHLPVQAPSPLTWVIAIAVGCPLGPSQLQPSGHFMHKTPTVSSPENYRPLKNTGQVVSHYPPLVPPSQSKSQSLYGNPRCIAFPSATSLDTHTRARTHTLALATSSV